MQLAMLKEDEKFEDAFFQITGESSRSILAYARTITDPWTYLEEVIKEIDQYLSLDHPIQVEEFIDRAKAFLEEVDASLETKRALQENEDHWHQVYDPNAETRFLRYNPREMVRDIWDMDTAMFFTESRVSENTRAEWKRVTKDQPIALRMLTEYGNFDIGLTEKSARASLRVRTQVRRGQPFLSIGAVQVNMNTGKVYCGVVGCKHTGQLSNRFLENGKTDKEWQEYQILRIIEHLGTHDKKGTWKAFPVFVEHASPKRDNEDYKLATHKMWCNNKECNC